MTGDIILPNWINIENYKVAVLSRLIGNFQNIIVSGNFAYIASLGYGLQTIDVSRSTPIQKFSYSNLELNDEIQCIAISGNYVYVGSYNGLQILYASPTTGLLFQGSYTHQQLSEYLCSPTLIDVWCGNGVGAIISGYYANSIAINNNFLYVLYTTGLQIFDVSNPSSPIPQGSYFTNGIGSACPYSIYISNNFLYVTTTNIGLQIFNIQNPTVFNKVGSYTGNELMNSALSVYVYAGFAYVSTSSHLYILNVKEPSNPYIVGSCSNVQPQLGGNADSFINNVVVSGLCSYKWCFGTHYDFANIKY